MGGGVEGRTGEHKCSDELIDDTNFRGLGVGGAAGQRPWTPKLLRGWHVDHGWDRARGRL